MEFMLNLALQKHSKVMSKCCLQILTATYLQFSFLLHVCRVLLDMTRTTGNCGKSTITHFGSTN